MFVGDIELELPDQFLFTLDIPHTIIFAKSFLNFFCMQGCHFPDNMKFPDFS